MNTKRLKRRILQLLENPKQKENIDHIIDEILNDVELSLYREMCLYKQIHSDQLRNIGSKLDYIIERGIKGNASGKCQFLEENRELIKNNFSAGIGSDERKKAVKHLADKLKGATSLVICDPYFLHWCNEKQLAQNVEQLEQLVEILPDSLQEIEIYTKPQAKAKDEKIFAILKDLLKKKEIEIKSQKTDKIHDRVWIKRIEGHKNYKTEAFVVGTSFNGLGKKLAFILDLPEDDKLRFEDSLNQYFGHF